LDLRSEVQLGPLLGLLLYDHDDNSSLFLYRIPFLAIFNSDFYSPFHFLNVYIYFIMEIVLSISMTVGMSPTRTSRHDKCCACRD